MNWEKVKLGDIIEIKKGKYITRNESREGPYPVILGGQEPAYYIDTFNHTGKAIVVSRSGASAGYVSFWNEPIFITDGYLIEPKGDVDIDFLYFLMKYHQSELHGKQGGSAIPHVNPRIINAIDVKLPPISIQKRIVDILSAYRELIDANNKRIKLLEQMAESLYKEWFIRFRFPGYTTNKCENSLPLGWEYKSVEDLSAVLQRGISPLYDDEGESWVINQKCIRKSIMDISEARKQSKVFNSILNLQDGDTVICSTGTGTLGRVGQVYGEYPHTTFDSHVTMVRAKEGVGKHFLYYSLKNLQPWFMSMGIGSTNQQELYRKTIKNAKVVVPDIGLMNMFEEHISTIHNQIILLSKSTECATKQRDMLLPRLMSGKLEV